VRATAIFERRLLAVLLPLALLGLTGWGVDLWTLPALVLVAAAPPGAPLLAGAVLTLFPTLALPRMGLVFLCGGVVRFRPRAGTVGPRAGARAWAFAAVIALVGWFSTTLAQAPVRSPEELRGEPAAFFAAANERASAVEELRGEGFRDIVGGETMPAVDARDFAVQRQLDSIHRTAKRREREATGAEREALIQVREAAARDGVVVPGSLRLRRETRDGRPVLWIHDPVDPADERFASHALFRQESTRLLRENTRLAAAVVFVLAVLLRMLRGRRHLMSDLWVAVLALVLGVTWVGAAEVAGVGGLAEPLLPVLAVAAFAASWGFVVGLGAVAALFPAALAAHLGAFVFAAAVRYFVREDDRSVARVD
jgi:hypothetical protein